MATLKQISRSLWEQIFPYEIRMGMEEVPQAQSGSRGQTFQRKTAMSKTIPPNPEANNKVAFPHRTPTRQH